MASLPHGGSAWNQLLGYLLRVAPSALLLVGLVIALLPAERGDRHTGQHTGVVDALRLCLHLLLFMVLRDGMTPAGLWSLHSSPFALRLSPNPWVLLGLTCACGAVVALLLAAEPLAQQLRWLVRGRPQARLAGTLSRAIGVGLGGAVVVGVGGGLAADLLTGGLGARVDGGQVQTGPAAGPVPASLLPALALFSFVGNAWEELLFRGMLQQRLLAVGAGLSRWACVVGSAAAFAACHAHLASPTWPRPPGLVLRVGYRDTPAGVYRV
jgi:membrane protease YdiL (CAAX protease family)